MRWLTALGVVASNGAMIGGLIGGLIGGCGNNREVSTLRYTSTDCPDPAGCEAPLGTDSQFKPPDEAQAERDEVAETVAGGPPPSCATVATALTALELGNYASDHDERDSILAKQRKACEAAKLDARETACMSTVTAVIHVGYCTRKMGAPTQRVALLDAASCKATVIKMRPSLQYTATNGEEHVKVFEESCVRDGWSQELATCFTSGAYDPLNSCRESAPGWVFDQINGRLETLLATKK